MLRVVFSGVLYASPPTRGEWIEIVRKDAEIMVNVSPPTRGEWIEIDAIRPGTVRAGRVSPHTGGVD